MKHNLYSQHMKHNLYSQHMKHNLCSPHLGLRAREGRRAQPAEVAPAAHGGRRHQVPAGGVDLRG
jgi:hypothetical protein